jgi:type IV pilus assembly protein PilQ
MKKLFQGLIPIAISLFLLSACTARTDKVEKELNVTDMKRDALTTVDKTSKEGPSIDYKKEKKPRRVNFSGFSEKQVLYPNFPISINFKNTNLSEGLVALGNVGGRNIITSDKVQGLLNMEISNEPWNEVFNAIIELKKLSYTGDPKVGIIKIYSMEDSEQTYSGSGNVGFIGTEIFNVYYEKPSEIKKQISALHATTGSDESSSDLIITENDENKTLIVKGTMKQIDEIERILNTIDNKKPQILIEAFLVEVSPTFSFKLGTRLGLTRSKITDTGAVETIRGGLGTSAANLTLGNSDSSLTNLLISGTSGLGIMRSTSSGDLKIEIDALEEEGDSKILSNPKLFTVSGKNAVIKQGVRFGVTESVVADGVTTNTVKYYDANLKLDVTPVVTGDGNVQLQVLITNDSVDTSVSPPKITKKEVSTNLILSDGDIAVVGGILTRTLTETNKRIPVLGKIPIIGALFRSREQQDDKTELLIFIAPRIV